jgi:hypothetical protein
LVGGAEGACLLVSRSAIVSLTFRSVTVTRTVTMTGRGSTRTAVTMTGRGSASAAVTAGCTSRTTMATWASVAAAAAAGGLNYPRVDPATGDYI